MALKTSAYIDSSAFIALRDKSDTYHSLFASLFAESKKLVTTSLVVAETHGWFLKRYDQHRALEFLNLIELLADLTIVSVGKEELLQAKNVILKYKDQKLTLVDAVGISMIKANKIKSCWSTDRHMRLSGAVLAIENY
jgi:predicted nucleic acid-binding protein